MLANRRTLVSRYITVKRFRAHVKKVLRDAYWKHISNISTFENDSSDPGIPKPEKIKKFWLFIKRKTEFLRQILRKKPTFVIGHLREDDSDPPSKGASPFSSMGDITVDPKCVAKLLEGLNVHKASGPDGLNARVHKTV